MVTDDDNRVKLKPIGGRSDCLHDYINASYIDVSLVEAAACVHAFVLRASWG